MDIDERNIDYVKLEKSAKRCMRISAMAVLATIFLPITVLTLILLDLNAVGITILALVWAIAIAYVIAVPHVRYERYRYCIDEEAIRVRQGFIWITEQIVPIERLHKIRVSQGPVDRIFKISKVCVTTAGGDVTIKFLKDERAAEVAEALKKKINDIAAKERESR